MSATGSTPGSTTRRSRRTVTAAALTALLAGLVGCTRSPATSAGPASPATSAAPSGGTWTPHAVATPGTAGCDTTVVAAGDIENDLAVARSTGRLAAAQRPDQVLVLGDNQYDRGTLTDYENGYDKTDWGRLLPVTNPVPGNHEYLTPQASGYYAYFQQPPPYYAFAAGCGWRGYALNSEVDLAAQAAWLRRDVAAHPRVPVVASWHRPRYSSGTEHGDGQDLQPFWDALRGRTGLVLNGHEHQYERFAPVGHLREFVIGTGGTSTYAFGTPVAGSERRIAHTPGVLRVHLLPHGYRWDFLTTDGRSADSGSA